MVVSSYAGVLAITDEPKETIKNLKQLENEGMYNKFGFYESIDFTPERVEKGKTIRGYKNIYGTSSRTNFIIN